MLNRLHVKEGQNGDDVRRRFDAQLKVSATWSVPGREMHQTDTENADKPWWWEGDEDASQNFLRAMGVTLDG